MGGLRAALRRLLRRTGDECVKERVAEDAPSPPDTRPTFEDSTTDVANAPNGEFTKTAVRESRTGTRVEQWIAHELCIDPVSLALCRDEWPTTLLPMDDVQSGEIRLKEGGRRSARCPDVFRPAAVPPTCRTPSGGSCCRRRRYVQEFEDQACCCSRSIAVHQSSISSAFTGGIHRRLDRMEEKLRELTSATLLTNDLINLSLGNCLANSDLTITAEEYFDDGEGSNPSSTETGRAVHSFEDDFLGTICLLRINRKLRFRISWSERPLSESFRWSLQSLSVQPDDGAQKRYREGNGNRMIHTGEGEAVVFFDSTRHRSGKLGTRSPWFGDPETKYVRLRMHLEFGTGSTPYTLRMVRDVYCNMVSENACMAHLDFKRAILRRWRQCPQWMRSRTRDALSLTGTAVSLVSLAVAGDPSGAAFILKGVSNLEERV